MEEDITRPKRRKEHIHPDDCNHDRGLFFTFGDVRDMSGKVVYKNRQDGWRCWKCNLLMEKVD